MMYLGNERRNGGMGSLADCGVYALVGHRTGREIPQWAAACRSGSAAAVRWPA